MMKILLLIASIVIKFIIMYINHLNKHIFECTAISYDSDDFILPFTSQQNKFELQNLTETESQTIYIESQNLEIEPETLDIDP